MPLDLARVARHPAALEVAQAGKELAVRVADLPCHEVLVVVELADADGDIDVLGQEIHPPLGEVEIDMDLRIPREERGEDVGERVARSRRGNTEHPAQLCLRPPPDPPRRRAARRAPAWRWRNTPSLPPSGARCAWCAPGARPRAASPAGPRAGSLSTWACRAAGPPPRSCQPPPRARRRRCRRGSPWHGARRRRPSAPHSSAHLPSTLPSGVALSINSAHAAGQAGSSG